jgi:hypothetical protein
MFCSKCGTQLPDQANFCWNCGKAVNEKAMKELLSPIEVRFILIANLKGDYDWDPTCDYIFKGVVTNQLTGNEVTHTFHKGTANYVSNAMDRVSEYQLGLEDHDICHKHVQVFFENLHNEGYNVYSALAEARRALALIRFMVANVPSKQPDRPWSSNAMGIRDDCLFEEVLQPR